MDNEKDIKKATSSNGLLSLNLSSNARALTLTANKSFSGTSASDKVVVTFSNGKKKTIKVKLTQPKTKKKFSLDDVKITLKRSYWNGSKSCLKYTITNNSSKNLLLPSTSFPHVGHFFPIIHSLLKILKIQLHAYTKLPKQYMVIYTHVYGHKHLV